MNASLFNRQLGSVSHDDFAKALNSRLLQSIQPAPRVTFGLAVAEDDDSHEHGNEGDEAVRSTAVAHAKGVNSIAIDRFEGRYLLSGGADSSIAIWDLEAAADASGTSATHLPLDYSARSSTNQSLGITHVGYYAFDSLAFLTGGYDQTLKLFSSETLKASATFDMGSVVYSHCMSDVSSHLLVACATQHPAVRLVDLRSGSNTHSLAGHAGSVLTVSWHPKNENVLASGACDGCVRVWDTRRSASSLGVLDMDDSIGIGGYDGGGTGARRRERGKAHKSTVNGLVWTEDGSHLVTTGLDEQMRVWDMCVGANTLANFGPGLRNSIPSVLLPLLAPSALSPPGAESVFYPNGQEILGFDLHSGTLRQRLRTPASQVRGISRRASNLKNRTTSLAWRAHDVEMYSAHSDGTIRCWRPHTWEDDAADQEQKCDDDDDEQEATERKRKRDELDDIVRNLTKKPITFT